MAALLFQESASLELLKPATDAKGSEWEVVLIRAGWSLNERYYPSDVLRKATPLFEGLKACAYRFGEKFDHVPDEATEKHPGGFARNVVGWFENVRYQKFKDAAGRTAEGIVARFHILEGAAWLRDNLRDAWLHGKHDILGFSIDARGEARVGIAEGREGHIVDRIDNIQETTVVSEPAAGGELLRLVASIQGDRGMDKIYAFLKESCPHWLRGQGEPEEGEINDYVLRVFESASSCADDELRSLIDTDDVKLLKEVGGGAKTISAALSLLRAGKVQDAMKALMKWMATYSESTEGNEGSREQGLYSKPFGKSQTGERKPAKESQEEGAMTDEEKRLKEIAHEEEEKKKKEEEEKKRLAALKRRESLLDAKEKVIESGLPKPAQERVLQLVDAKETFSDEDVDGIINAEREYIKAFSESGKVKGLGEGDEEGDRKDRIKITKEQETKWEHAFDGMLIGNGELVEGVRPFATLTEAFVTICRPSRYVSRRAMAREIFKATSCAFPSDEETYYAEHSEMLRESWNAVSKTIGLKESTTSSTFSRIFGDRINLFLQKLYTSDPRNDYKKIVSNNLNANDFTNSIRLLRVGGFSDMPVVPEGAPYQELNPTRTENEETISPQKRGGTEKLTMEAILADRVDVVRRIPRDLARSAVRTASKDVWNNIEANPTTQDGFALISSDHNNLITGAISATLVADAIQLLRDQIEQDSNEKIGLQPKYLIVGTKLEDTAFEIVSSDVKATGTEDLTVANFVKSKGIEVISTLGLGRTTATDDHWWIAASPRDADTIAAGWLDGRQTVEVMVQPINSLQGEAFTADVQTYKARMNYVGSSLYDHRWIAGSLQ